MSNVKVAVRVRPLSKKEREKNAKFIVDVSGDTISVENIKVDGQSDFGDSRERFKNFTFDYCYDSSVEPSSPAFASQELVFQDLGTEVLQAAFEGYNACLFAYGQTSTGKTYTMMGGQEDAGLIPRICEGLFSHVDNFVDQDNLSFHVKISYLEIYNERVRDLLRPSLLKKNEKYTLKVREHPKEGPYVHDLSTHFIHDNQQIQAILERGNEYRTTASTYMHDHSSRSHAIVTIEFTQAKLEDDLPHEIVSKLHLVDLAGSERADPNYWSGYKGRLREGSNINKSLVTLGNVIKALAERSILSCSSDNLGASVASIQSGGEGATPKKRLPYIPYRDSVLTWLLKDSLGGNSKTMMISTITPASMYYNETLSTLRYAQRAKSIINKPKVNEDPNVSLIRDLRREIERLREMLVSTRMANSRSSLNEIVFLLPSNIQKMHEIDTDSEQGDSFLQLPDSNSVLAEKLQENENMVDKLTQTWIDKWREAHEAIRDSDLSIRGLKGKSNSMGVLIESQMPHLVGMDDDILSTGVTIYYLKEGKTLLGREDADREQDIVLSGPSVQKEHCFIKNTLGNVIIHPNRRANCAINGIDCRGPTCLKQGDYILLGKTNMFRFNNPAEAAKLRISRQNLAIATSHESLDQSNPSSPDTDRHVHPLYAHCDASEFCHQLEKDFDSDPKRIEEAKRELQRVREEHRKAEEERQRREEELWRLHESHKQEIEQQRQSLSEIAKENLTQHQIAEEELAYARDCLQQEKEAFQQFLQEELAKVKRGQAQSEFGSQTELVVVQTSDVGCDQGLQDIERKKESLQGQIKALAQGELIRHLSYRDSEQRLLEEAEEIEEQYQTTQDQLNAELHQLEEVEKGYRSEDRSQLQDITRTNDDLTQLDRQQEQLHLYIEEKQCLMQVGLDVPRPLRSACSEEVLTDNQTSSLGFPFRASSLLALKQGSEGDLPSLSTRLSLSSSLNITSLDSVPDSMESMDTSPSSQSSVSAPVETRKRSSKSPASEKLTSGAKEVTSRLYTAPPPKFKYEPKQKSKVVPKSTSVRKQDSKKVMSAESKKGKEDGKPTNLRKSKSPSPGRSTVSLSGRQTTPPPGKHVSPSPKKQATPSQNRHKPLRSEQSSKTEKLEKEKTGFDGLSGQAPGVTKQMRHDTDESGVFPRLRQSVSQPTLSLNRGLSNNKLPRLPPTKLRPITSATSLASVPEAASEEVEAIDQSQVSESPVVRRRKKRQFDEDDTRRHSEPVGESLADAFEKYSQEMEGGIEIPVILLHKDSPDEQIWARQHSSSISDSIAGEHPVQEPVDYSLGSSVDGPGRPTDNQCNVNSVCDGATQQVELSHMLENKPCNVDDSVFSNDLAYQQEQVGRSVELDSDSGFYPESSDNFESSGALSFADSTNNFQGRTSIGSEQDPQGSVPHTGLLGAVALDCDTNFSASCKMDPDMNNENLAFTGNSDESDIMESSLISPTDVSLHLSQDTESDSGKSERKREHGDSAGDSQTDIPTKCKKKENLSSDNVYVMSPEQLEINFPEERTLQNIPQSSTQNLNAQLTFNRSFQATSGFVVCDILQDTAKTISADLDGAHRSYSSDSLEDADSLDGSQPWAREQELTDSLENSDVDHREEDLNPKEQQEQLDTGFLHEEPNDTGFLQGEPNDTGFLQGEPNDTGFLQGEQKDTGFLQGEQKDTGFLQGEQKDTGFLQGEQNDTGFLQEEQNNSQTEESENNESNTCVNDELSTSKCHEMCESVSTIDLERETEDQRPNLSQTNISTPATYYKVGDKTLSRSEVNICSIPNTVSEPSVVSCPGELDSSVNESSVVVCPIELDMPVSEPPVVVCHVERESSGSEPSVVVHPDNLGSVLTCPVELDSSVSEHSVVVCPGQLDLSVSEPSVLACPGVLDSSVSDEPSGVICPGELDSSVSEPTLMVCPGELDSSVSVPSEVICPGELDSSVSEPTLMVCPGELDISVGEPSEVICPGELDSSVSEPTLMVCPGELDPSVSEPSVVVCPGELESSVSELTLMVCPGELDSSVSEPSVVICPDELDSSVSEPTLMVCPGELDSSVSEPSVVICPDELDSSVSEPTLMACTGELDSSVSEPTLMVCPGELDSSVSEPTLMVCPGELDLSVSEPSVLTCPGELYSSVSEPSVVVFPENSLSQDHSSNDNAVQHVNASLQLNDSDSNLSELSKTEAEFTKHHPNTNQGHVISVTESSPTCHHPVTDHKQLTVVSAAALTPDEHTKDDSSCQTDLPCNMIFTPISSASEKFIGQVTDQPFTQSPGIKTDVLTSQEEDVGRASDCSQDSIQELQEQLQQLEEFPGQPGLKGVGPSAYPPLSSSRRATRHRAMIRQKRRGVEESDDISPESGDSLGSGNVSRPSSRPDSASKRRRRIIKSKSERRSNLKAPSSEDYVNSESDNVCSDDSVLASESRDVKSVSLDECDHSVTYSDFAEQLAFALGEQRESTNVHDNVSYTCDYEKNNEDSCDKRSNLNRDQTKSEFNMDGHYLNGITNQEDDNSRGAIPKKKSKHAKRRSSSGSSTSDTDLRPSSRAPSETRDMEQQTDVSWLEFPEISTSRRKSPVLNISPLSVWNSGDRRMKASNGPHGSGGLNVTMDSRHIKKSKKTKPVKLEFTSPDVWSAGTWVEDYAASGKLDADFSSDSDDDHAYVMETEVFSPQSPTACDKFFDDGDSSDTKEDSNSVKYYVTINEENTNISYNVDRTEHKTYSLRSQIQPNEQMMSIPESIHVNLTSTDSHTSESRHTSSTLQRVYLSNSDSASSPEQNVVVSERTFRSVHEASRDEDDVIDRHFEDENTASYLDLCPGTSTPHVTLGTGDINKNGVLSPRESDTTSDYGTMIMDNRRDFMSFTLDSGDEEGSLASGYKSHTDNQDSSPLDSEVFALPNGESNLLLAEVGHVAKMNMEDVGSISQDGQQLCSSEQISRRNVIAGAHQIPCEPELLSNVISSDQIDDVSDDSDLEGNEFVQAESVPHTTKVAQQVLGAIARMSALYQKNGEDNDDLSVSLDRLQGPDSVSSDSSIYKTPQQSPRDHEEEDTTAIENVEIPDRPRSPQISTCRKYEETQNSLPKSPSTAEQMTGSVMADPQSVPFIRRMTDDESSVREDLKRELQQKLARLQKHVRSLSDSAISSDYTDGDSTSVSPRGSRLYESDKTLRGGLFIDQTEPRYPEDIQVMVTQARTQFDPSASGQPFSSTVHKLLDIDNKTPKKSPLKDSGNVFDDSDYGEQVEESIIPARVVKKESAVFVPVDNEDINISAVANSRSLSPGELVLNVSGSSEDIFESVGSGSSDLEEVYKINADAASSDQLDNSIVPRSLPDMQRSVKKEKSPSMSDISTPRCDRDLKRSMSEANVDDYDEITSSESSNDSIVFVFMGQSHTTESMEKLQKEYNPLSFESDSEPICKLSRVGESTSQLKSEDMMNEEHAFDNDHVKLGDSDLLRENEIILKSKEDLNLANMSPDHTGECHYKNYGDDDDDDDNEPLRHKFGIDESVLPIPVRSVSSDNIPKQTLSNLIVHRSRSTDLLEVNPKENPNDPSNNEGIFPPTVGSDFWDNVHGYDGNVIVIEEYYSDDSDTKNNGGDINLNNSKDRFIDEEQMTAEEITYSELSSTHPFIGRENASETIDYSGNLNNVEMLDQNEKSSSDFSSFPILNTSGQIVSDDIQVCLTDTGTQTDIVENTNENNQQDSQVLPALPYRAQSMGDINHVDSSITLSLPEGTENWENLSHMVIESTALVNNINQKIQGVHTISGSSSEMLASPFPTSRSHSDHSSSTSHKEAQDDSTQTTGSLTAVHNLGIQTEEEWMLFDREDMPDNSNDSTQTDTEITRPRELSETETTDIILLPAELSADFDIVFPPESSREMSCQTSPDTTVDTMDSSMQTDEFEKVLSRLRLALKNSDGEPEEMEEEIKPSVVGGVNAQKKLKLSSGHATSRVQDQTVIECNEEAHHLRKNTSMKEQTQTVMIERESVIETEANIPDMDVTNAEMEALKAEHMKMMESLKKAAKGRKIRTHELKVRLEKQTKLEQDHNSEYNSRISSHDQHISDLDTKCDESWHDTHLSSDIKFKSFTPKSDKTMELEQSSTKEERDETGDLDSIVKDSHQYLGSNENLDNIDDILSDNTQEMSKSRTPAEARSPRVRKGRKHKEVSIVPDSPAEVIEDIVLPARKSDQQTSLLSLEAEADSHRNSEVSRLDSLSSLTSEGTLLGEEVSQYLNDKDNSCSWNTTKDNRSGAKNRTLITRGSATSEPIDDALSDREGSPLLQTPPNSPTALGSSELKTSQYQNPQAYLRSPEVQPNYLAALRKQPPVTRSTDTNGKISTGVEVSVDSSDDFTQTDIQALKLDLSEFSADSNRNSETRTAHIKTNSAIKSELSRLQKERVEIIELLSMNYLPASLTVELLEAKLNYCIGQTDTLLKTLEETWDGADFNTTNVHHLHQTDITREYVTNYRHDLQKSKWDIQICKEKMNRTVKQGTGRGRTRTRNKDIARWKRLEEIEAFKAERFMEQQKYERARSISPLKKASPCENERHSRSVSPSSLETSPRLMTPKQHREHLVDLRRALVEVTERDENAYRASRSCSPQLSHYDETERIYSPRSSSYNCTPQTSPVHHRYSSHASPEQHYIQRTSVSPRSSPLRHASPRHSPEHQPYRMEYGSTSSLSVPEQHVLNISVRSYSHSPSRTYTPPRSDDYSETYLTPRVASSSPHRTLARPRRTRSDHDDIPDRESRGNDQLYALQETRDLFRDMQEARMQNQQEISRAQNTLLHSTRNYSGMRSRTGSNASSRRSYSSYRDYARDLIEGSQRSIHGVVSGSYELYDDNPRHTRDTGVTSPPASIVSDLESLPDSILSEQYMNNTTPSFYNTDPSFLRSRPINSADIKSRLRRQRKVPSTS
ncbi:uncharacterized protein LOC132559734 [Ylistrum balloti]|uniref:uncharacterized protein LOC132559734 n=1 Tax=Ylistrum balloti TaxID=509963 RepID=UPI002905AF81|nr:uncharacterized protein LOC132559734 [Ylistrum balloti]